MVEFDLNPNPLMLVAQFETFGIDIRSYREPLKRSVQQVLAPSFKKNFDEGGRPEWDELSDDTKRQKQALGFDKGTLIRTGKLMKVAQQLNIWDIKTDSAQVITLPGAEYGGIQQAGYEPNNLPARPFMVAQDEDEDAIAEVFGGWLLERALAAGIISRFI